MDHLQKENNRVYAAAPTQSNLQRLKLSTVEPDIPVIATTDGDVDSDGPSPRSSDDDISDELRDEKAASIAFNMRKNTPRGTQNDVVRELYDGRSLLKRSIVKKEIGSVLPLPQPSASIV